MIDKLVLLREDIVVGLFGLQLEDYTTEAELAAFDEISLATVKKVFKWGDEPCTEHWKRIIPHRDCLLCQKEIEKELKEV